MVEARISQSHVQCYVLFLIVDFRHLEALENQFLGSYAVLCIQTSKSEAILDVCHFEDEMTRDSSLKVEVVWVLVAFKLFRRPLLLARCSRSVFPVLGKF